MRVVLFDQADLVVTADRLADDPGKPPIGFVASTRGAEHQTDSSTRAGSRKLREPELAARSLDRRRALRDQRYAQSARHALHSGRQRGGPGIGKVGTHTRPLADV